MNLLAEKSLAFLPLLRKSASRQIRLDYDVEADLIDINFGSDNYADDSEPIESDLIARKRSGKIIGYTILNASSKI